MANIILDQFTDTNDTAISAHVPDTSLPSSWFQTASNSFYIQSNSVQPNRYTDGDLATIQSGLSDFTLQAAITPYNSPGNSGFPGLVFRYSDSSNFWYGFANSGSGWISVYQVVGGVHTERIRYTTTVSSGAPITIRIDCYGPNITLFVNGVEATTYVSTFNQTATIVGLRCGKVNSPVGKPSWDSFQLTPFSGLIINWPIFTEYEANPLVPLGTGNLWDSADVNNPNVFWDAFNGRWVMYYSGYKAGNGGIQNMGIAYANDLFGPWTKEAANPVYLSQPGDVYSMNGALVKLGGTWFHYYVANNITTIDLATSTDLIHWTRVGTVIHGSGWEGNSVYDPCARIKEDGITIELVYAASGSSRGIGIATSTDGINFVKDSRNPLFTTVTSHDNDYSEFGEPCIFVPPGKEGVEMLISYQSALSDNNGRRAIYQALTVDNGVTWHFRSRALEFGTGWESVQVCDPFILKYNNILYMFHAGANLPGGALDLNLQIGVATVPFPNNSFLPVSPPANTPGGFASFGTKKMEVF